MKMTPTLLKSACTCLTLLLLSACGGGAEPAASSMAAASPAPARVLASACDGTECAPVIDGLAEEFRSHAQRAKVDAEAQASAAPAYPQVAPDAVMAPPPGKPEAFGAEGQ
jgi:hypothetical protein